MTRIDGQYMDNNPGSRQTTLYLKAGGSVSYPWIYITKAGLFITKLMHGSRYCTDNNNTDL